MQEECGNLGGAAEPASRRVCPGRRSIFTWSISAAVSRPGGRGLQAGQ